MPNHKAFQRMTPMEKSLRMGQLSHLYANSPTLFRELNQIIKAAESAGMFDGVEFFPMMEEDLPQPEQQLNFTEK